MNRHPHKLVILVLGAALAVALAGCTSPGATGTSSTSGGSGTQPPGGTNSGTGGKMGGSSGAAGTYSSVGQRIYLTGVGSNGQNIPHTSTRVAQGSLMMGGGGCGSCHAANGRGGTISMMTGEAIKVPDVTYGALIKSGLTDANIRTAIHDGLDETGKRLQSSMPRWQMTDPDLDATIAYLKELGAK